MASIKCVWGCRSDEERGTLEAFVRIVLPNAMEKGCEADHHRSWATSIQSDLLEANVAFSRMCCSALLYLCHNPGSVWLQTESSTVTTAQLVSSIVDSFKSVISPDTAYAKWFRNSMLPSPAPQFMADAAALASPDVPAPWYTLAALNFRHHGGWELLCKVRARLMCLYEPAQFC